MGYELWEQFGGKLPEVILYPTGGGVGLIGMCKAFDEMQEMGWIGTERPRMVAVQGRGLRANRPGVARTPEFVSVLPERCDYRFRPARAGAARRSFDFEHASADERNRADRD